MTKQVTIQCHETDYSVVVRVSSFEEAQKLREKLLADEPNAVTRPDLPRCPHGATAEEACPECVGAPSDDPDDELVSARTT